MTDYEALSETVEKPRHQSLALAAVAARSATTIMRRVMRLRSWVRS